LDRATADLTLNVVLEQFGESREERAEIRALAAQIAGNLNEKHIESIMIKF